ncbi:MAG TPA: dTMP kinase [Actinomycetota bacterium]
MTTDSTTDQPPRARSSVLSLLRRRYFRRLWAVTSVSSLGDWVGVFALTIYVAQLSGRPEFAVGGVLLFRVIPGLLIGPFAGVLADRFDRRRLMVSADVTRALLIASIPWIHNLWGLYAVSAGLEVLQLIWAPAKDAALPNLVEREELLTANQLSLVSTYATFPLGGAIVSLLAIPAAYLARVDFFSVLREQPIALAFFFDAATFLFSALMVASFPSAQMRATRVHTTATAGWNPLRDLAEGIRFVGRNPAIRTPVFGAWIAFTGGSAIVSLGPIFVDHIVGGSQAASQAAWGVLIVSVGIGLVFGMAVAGFIARHVDRERVFPMGLVVSGAAAIVTASMTSIKPVLPVVVVIGFGAGVAWVTIFTLLQERTEDRLRGRTFATLQSGIQLSLFIGLGGWPLLAGAFGNHTLTTEGYSIDLAGFRVAIWAGGLFMVYSGFAAARTIRVARGLRRSARFRGLGLRAGLAGGARRGLFIAFEGVEGAGKSTQMRKLQEWLRANGHDVVVTREPGGTPIAERVRHILLDPGNREMDAKTEALLYAAGRAQHVADTIRPALERDAIVLCDRYVDSSLAYQGFARGLGEADVLNLSAWATDELLPDVVVLLHLDPEAGLARTAGDPDRIEQEDVSFHRTVGEAYLKLARQYPSRFTIVDASGDLDAVQQQIRTAILPFLRESA